MAKSPDPHKKPTPPSDPQPGGEDQPILDEEAFAELLSEEDTPASEVNLGNPSGGRPPKPPSGQSSTIWADLVKDPSSGGDAGAIDFDAPSDAEVVKNALGEEVSPLDSDVDVLGQAIVPPGAESSRVDLFDPPPQDDPLHSRNYPPPGQSEEISGLSGSHGPQPAESDINLGPDLPLATQHPTPRAAKPVPPSMRRDSTLDFGAPIAGTGELSSRAESGIDLGLSGLVKPEPPSHVESGIDLASAAVIDMDEEEKIAGAKPVESGIDIGSAAVVDISSEEDAEGAVLLDSGVDLTAAASSDADMEGAVPLDSSSGMNLEGAQVVEDEDGTGGFTFPPPTGEKMLQPSSDSDIIIGADDAALVGASGSAVNLDMVNEKGSSRDLIAEAVESGVDLTGAAKAVVDEEAEAVILTGSEAEGDSSSAVDLGASVVTEEDEPAAAAGLSPEDLALEKIKSEEDMDFVGAAILDDEDDTAGATLLDDEGVASASGVEMGSAAVLDESAEGTLEDKEEGAAAADVDDFLSSMGTVTDESKETADEAEPIEEGLAEDTGEAPGLFADEEPAAEAAVDSGEEKEEEEEEEYRPPPKPKYGRRWVGGTLVGMTLAAAAGVALITFNEGLTKQLGDQVRGLIGYEDDTASGPGPSKTGGKKPGPDGQQTAGIRDKVKSGDFTGDPPAIDENSTEDLAARGEYYWKNYLTKAQPPFDEKAPEVQKALKDLEDAPKKTSGKDTGAQAAADALYWRGHIQETLGHRKEALEIYQSAPVKFPANTELHQRFQDAIDRLDVVLPVQAPAPMGAGARAPIEYYGFDLEYLAGQAPPPPPPEAGPDFWRAFKAALNFDFGNAVKSLDVALDKHKKRRLSQIGKPQNPNSDPTEEIFIKAGEQLRILWQLQQRMQEYQKPKPAALAADAPKALKDLEGLYTELTKARAELETVTMERDKIKKEYATLDADKKDADKKIIALTTERDAEKKAKETAVADLVIEQKNVAVEKEKVVAAGLIIARLEKDKQLLGETIVGTGEKVGLRDIDPVRSKSILFQRLDDLVEVAKKVDPDNRLAMSVVEIRNLNAALTQRWPPEVMLGFWTPLLADRTRKDLAADALKDVDRVKANAKAPLEVRSQAFAVEGLALRNQGDYVKARTALGEAMRGDVAGPTWKPIAKGVLKELTDPAASYLPRAADLRAKRRYDDALDVLDEGLKVFSDKGGELLALRSQVQLEKALSGERKFDPLAAAVQGAIKDALDDAEAAIKAGAEGAGHFAAARLAEEMGKRPEAEQLYRKAMAELPAEHPDTARARVAVARLLLQGVEPKPEPMPKTSRAPGIKGHQLGFFRLPDVAALVMADLPPPEDEAKIKEAIRLADEVLAGKDINQFPLLKAQALAVKGLWTQALNTYVQGLKPHLSREHYEGLKYLVENHPLQRRPDVARIEHPFQGEKHYAQGLTRYYNREYAPAKKEFSKAIENFEHDARYHYFLGLAQLAQGKLGAAENFEQGAKLEIDNRPGPGAVNAALERIQGQPRTLINEARERVR